MPDSRRVFLSRAALTAGAILNVRLAKANGTYADALRRIGKVQIVKAWTETWHPMQRDTNALDLALTAMQTKRDVDASGCLPERISVLDTRGAVWSFADVLLHLEASGFTSTGFFGENGTLLVAPDVWTLYLPDGSAEQRKPIGSRLPPYPDRRLITMLLHLGQISYELGRDIRFDPRAHSITGDEAANALFLSPYRTRQSTLTV